MWLAFFDTGNAQTYYSEVVRLAEVDSWIDGTYYSLQSMEQMSNVFRGNSNEGLFEIVQNITMGEVFDTNNMWCTKVVYEVRNKTEADFAYSEAFLTHLYPEETNDMRKPGGKLAFLRNGASESFLKND